MFSKKLQIGVLGLMLIIGNPIMVTAEMLSVGSRDVNLHSGPGEDQPIKWQYHKGFPLQVLETSGDWVKVEDFEKDVGWVERSALSKDPHMVVIAANSSNSKINIRSGPSEENAIVGETLHGVVFATVAYKRGWVKVRHESGLEGWIKRSLLWGF